MGLTGITIFRLATAALLPVLVAVMFYLAQTKTNGKFESMPYMTKQLIIGISFGVIAILATEFGIPVDGAVLNVRNAAPLTSGLIFGWPSGIIAGLVGGVERWFSDAGDFTRVACSVSTFLAGIIGASIRRFMNDNKKASWFYGLAVGVTVEVLHMLLVFLSNASDIHRAFNIVQICAVPMIVANSLSVMLSIVVIATLIKRGEKKRIIHKTKENLAQTFQKWLLICVIVAFSATIFFTHAFQTQIAHATAEMTLKTGLEDVRNDIKDISNRHLLDITKDIADDIGNKANMTQNELKEMAERYGVSEINIIDKDGIIIGSTDNEIIGFDMSSGKQSGEFLALLDGEKEFIQDYQAISRDSDIYRKYAGVALASGFVQAGYDPANFYEHLHEEMIYIAENRRVGHEGSIIICDGNGMIVSDRENHEGEHISIFGDASDLQIKQDECFSAEIYDKPSLMMYTETESYYIIGILSEEEAFLSKNASVYMLAFMELLVFALLFATIFTLIKRLVVANIRKINDSLALITKGNLNVTVDVRDNEEFASLSDDINSTVATLKQYIEEAAARFDKDLEIAKTIQRSALPSVFPPYPNRKDFSIFASMDAAKEVGGDFYDFYMLDDNRLAFVIADVSGKGIPGAMFMMTSKTLIKSHAESGLPVDEIFTQVNEKLCENNEADMFVTAWLGILNLETGLLCYANAGHNPPLIKHKDGSYEYLKGKANFVLAGMDGIKYRKQQLQLEAGDEIYLYTDGVTEAHNVDKQLFGEERLLDSLNNTDGLTVDEVCKKVKDDVVVFVGEAEQFDDITMLCVRLNEVVKMTITKNPTMDSVADVASFVEEQLEKLEIPMKFATKLMVAVDEIYSNIVRYSGATEAQVSVFKEENAVKLVFGDNGKPYNPLIAEEPDITASAEEREIGGLGIFMVRKMMDDIKYVHKDDRNILSLTLNI